MDDRGLDEVVLQAGTPHTRREALWLTAGIAGLAVAAANHVTEAKNGKRNKGHKGHKGHHRRKHRKGGGGNGGDGSGNQPGGPVQRPFPQHLTYVVGTIRPNHLSQEQQDDDLRAAYGRWKDRYLVNEGGGLYRVAFGRPGDGNHGTTVSEGQGFGMVIVPHMAGYDPDAQAIFEGLWRFARNHPSGIDSRLMDWKVPGGNDPDSAFDGDCDMAYGLLLAHAQWGSGGAIDYSTEAQQLLAGILASTIGPNSRLPLLGDWVKPNDGSKFNEWSPRTSDFMPGHFRAFRLFTGDAVWDQVIAACQRYIGDLQGGYSPNTGLLPDFAQSTGSSDPPRPASPGFLEGANDGNYNYNAGRDPWRIGTDALLNGDATSLSQTRKIAQWIAGSTGGDPHNIRSGYHLDGNPLDGSNYFSTFFAAPFGVAAMTDSNLQSWLNAVYDAVIGSDQGYYEDSVALLCSLVLTGNFWSP